MGCSLLTKVDGTNQNRKKLYIFLVMCFLVTCLYVASLECYRNTVRSDGSFGRTQTTGENSPSEGAKPRRRPKNRKLMNLPKELVAYDSLCTLLENDEDETENDEDYLDVGTNSKRDVLYDIVSVAGDVNWANQDHDEDIEYNGEYEQTDEDYDYIGSDDSPQRRGNSIYEERRKHGAVGFSWSDVVSLGTPPFSKDYKNPCWVEHIKSTNLYSGHYYSTGHSQMYAHLKRVWARRLSKGHDWRLRCLPYFFITGQPKSGTTDLFHKMALHPAIIKPAQKEPHWWTRRRFLPCDGSNRTCCPSEETVSLKEYADVFDQAAECIRSQTASERTQNSKPSNVIVGEGSASTFWDNDVWRLLPGNQPQNKTDRVIEPRLVNANYINELLPDAKFIVILRDPTERLYSDYLYFHEKQSVEDFHRRVEDSINNMEDCFRNRTVRSCVYDHKINRGGRQPVRLRLGIYSVFLRDWLEVFPRDQILVLQTEDYAENPLHVLNRVFKFLEIDPMPRRFGKTLRQLPKANTRREEDKEIGAMLPETKAILRQFYATYNAELAKILKDKRFLWES